MPRAWLLAALAVGCATTPAVTPTFTYAPPAGTRLVRTVKLVNETSLVGSPYRQREEQEFVWNVAFAREGGKHAGDAAAPAGGGADQRCRPPRWRADAGGGLSVDLVVSPEPRVVEVRGAERAAEVLGGLVSAGLERARGMFGPEQVKDLAVARFEMVVRDVMATRPRPAPRPGRPPIRDPAVKQKTMTVDRLEPCAARALCPGERAVRRGPPGRRATSAALRRGLPRPQRRGSPLRGRGTSMPGWTTATSCCWSRGHWSTTERRSPRLRT